MGWSQSFINSLQSPAVTAKYILRLTNMPNFAGDSATITGGFATGAKLQISDEGPKINGSSIIPGSFNISFGSFSVPLVGDITEIFPAARKGSIAELFCIINGQKERIAIGQLKNISGFSNRWSMDFTDLISAMTSRADTRTGNGTDNDPDHFSWFYNCGLSANNTTAWNESGGNFPTTIVVDDVRPFLDNKEHGEKGLIRCVDSSNNEFYLTYDSATVTSGTIGFITLSKTYTTSDQEYPSLQTCSNLAINSTIYAVALLKGKPYEIFAKLLLSRDGNNTNYFDKYPASWTYGGFLNDDMFDLGDARNQKYIKSTDEAGAPYKWDYLVSGTWSNGIREFVTQCSKTGQFPVYRQDSITWRGAQNPNTAQNIATILRDDNIISINKIDIFDPNQKNVYKRSRMIYGKTSSTTELAANQFISNDLQSIPALSKITRDNSYLYGYDPVTDATNRSKCALEDMQRLFNFDYNTWSKISLTLPLKYAFLSTGDIVEIQSRYINVFIDARYGLRGMILSHGYSIGSQKVDIQLLILGKTIN